MPSAPSADYEPIEPRLRAFLERRLGEGSLIELEQVRRLQSGRSKENWLVDATWTDGDGRGPHPLIVRADQDDGLLDTDRRTEFDLLQALDGSELPAPRALWLDPKGDELGRPALVMERLAGECDHFILSNAVRPLEARVAIARRCIALLAEVHRVDWQDLGLGEILPVPRGRPSLEALEHWEGVLRKAAVEPMPELTFAAGWLRKRAPEAQAMVLVHADFKPGNLLFVGDEIRALLDWETAHIGDPLEDLGWVTQPVRAREHQIGGRWEPNDIVVEYRAATGFEVSEDDLAWWSVLASYKACAIQTTGLSHFLRGRGDELFSAPTRSLRALLDVIEARG